MYADAQTHTIEVANKSLKQSLSQNFTHLMHTHTYLDNRDKENVI